MENLIILGAGRIGKLVYQNMLAEGAIWPNKKIYFYDNDLKKQGSYRYGILVLTYEDFRKMIQTENCEIMLATDYWREMIQVCMELKVENKIVGIYGSYVFDSNPYAMRVYGQDAEDIYLSEKFEEQYSYDYKGFYVDVGAHHPYRFSNTYWAYAKEWKGINIEPNTDVIQLFNKVRSRDININCGISNEKRIMKYYRFEEPAFNTFDENEFRGIRIPKESIDVEVRTLKSILAEYRVDNIDFMNIDVEGMEMQVLQSNDWERYRPSYILIEQKNISAQELVKSNIYKYLRNFGYECEWKGIRTAIYKKWD